MNTDGNKIATYKYEYDSDGRLIKETKTQGGQDTVKTYDYDEFGRAVKDEKE